jgi:hypothetical protein
MKCARPRVLIANFNQVETHEELRSRFNWSIIIGPLRKIVSFCGHYKEDKYFHLTLLLLFAMLSEVYIATVTLYVLSLM